MKVEKKFIADDGTVFQSAVECLKHDGEGYGVNAYGRIIDDIHFPFCEYIFPDAGYYMVKVKNTNEIAALLDYIENDMNIAYCEGLQSVIDVCVTLADPSGSFPVTRFIIAQDGTESSVMDEITLHEFILKSEDTLAKIKQDFGWNN